MTRRPTVNFMNQGTANKIASGEPDAKDYCPSCGIRLKYTSRLNDFFCSQCGYVRREGKPVSFIVDGPNYNDRRKGPLKSSSSGSSAAAADDSSNLFMTPISKTRSQESLEDSRRRRIQGYDNDIKHFEKLGYNIIDSYEHVPTDNSTFDSNEAKGSFSNLASNRRMYFH